MRPSAVAELPKTVGITASGVTSDQKLAKLAKMTERAYIAEIASHERFC
jgi:hypothetical protein